MITKTQGWCAWHPTLGFDAHHYEGPLVYADLDDDLISDVADLNDDKPGLWRAVKVDIVKAG